jgi:hypothetical protein
MDFVKTKKSHPKVALSVANYLRNLRSFTTLIVDILAKNLAYLSAVVSLIFEVLHYILRQPYIYFN